MKKYFAYLIFASALLFLLPSCDNNGGDVELEEGTLKLTLTCNDLGLTRAENGDDNYKENTIKSIDCYFYKKTDGFNTAAAVVKSIKNIQNAVGSYTANIKFEQTEFEALFDKNATTEQQCLIYVIANYSGTLPIQDNASTADVVETSIDHLKGLEVGSSFDNYTIDDSWSFVMDSEGDATIDVATLSADKKSLTGTIPLYRTAAKITLDINRFGPEETSGYVTLGSDIYKPYIGGIYAVLHNGVKKSTIAPDVVPLAKSEGDYFTRNSLEFTDITTDGKTSHSLKQPLYSYASDWSGESNIEDYVFDPEAYITLVVPWKKVSSVDDEVSSDDGTEDYYYKVPISYRDKKIERNTYYKINISVSILGTLDPTQTVPLTPSYEIIDWSTEQIGTNMETMRYLMVEKNHYVMNNVNEIYIPYWSSHECSKTTITNHGKTAYVVQQDLSGNTPVYESISETSYTLTLEIDGEKYIKYTKVLENDYREDDFDFTPYEIALRICHEDNDSFYEEITITQYPAIYAIAEENWDYSNDYNNKSGVNGNKGFVFVNGYTGNDNTTWDEDNDWFFGSVPGNSNTTNRQSPNRYKFTITSVEETPYVIGDPREMTPTFSSNSAEWRNGRRITATDDKSVSLDKNANYILQNYYGTDGGERTRNMLAPKFMLASGYALLHTNASAGMDKLIQLKKRCASYQEDGYPAGRWRLPTQAEFQFIMSQVDKEALPDMYVKDKTYWCAHGIGTPKGDGVIQMTYTDDTKGTGYSTRCVYDLWYWGEHDKMTTPDDKNVFTWGDVLRSEKAYTPPMNH